MVLTYIPLGVSAAEPKEEIKALNVENGATVNAYKIVGAAYDSSGNLTGFNLTDSTNGPIANVQSPTATEITSIANYIGANPGQTTMKKIQMTANASGEYTAQAEPGMYIILVTAPTGSQTVYNPGIVSVNVTDANQVDASKLRPGLVDFATGFLEGSTTAYIKSTKPDLEKKIANSSKNDKGDTVAFGDTVNFEIKSTVPSFSGNYVNPVYSISDTLENQSFVPYADTDPKPVVTLNKGIAGERILSEGTDYTLTRVAGSLAFTIDFSQSFLNAHATDTNRPTITVEYSAKIADTAKVNFEGNPNTGNTNTAKLKYSNNPSDSNSFVEIEKKTYNYTFEYQAKKVDTGGNGLGNAEFKLYRDESLATTSEVGTAISKTDGLISFKGLDEGTYYLKETVAPSGYSILAEIYKIDISSTLNSDGKLSSYTVTTSKKDSSNNWGVVKTATFGPTTQPDPAHIVNKKLSELPSTGGEGTRLLMAIASLLAVISLSIALVTSIKSKSRNK